jgi:hypothetical protein
MKVERRKIERLNQLGTLILVAGVVGTSWRRWH